MILQALCEYYDRLLKQKDSDVSRLGYSSENISYEVLLAEDGRVIQVNNICDTLGKKEEPRAIQVPQAVIRTRNIKPNFLWDKTNYALGVGADNRVCDEEHQAFRAFNLKLISPDIEDAGLLAFRRFLEKWTPDQFVSPMFSEAMRGRNLVFRFEGDRDVFLHDRDAARRLCAYVDSVSLDEAGESSESWADKIVTCLITGQQGHLARLHHPIKGVRGKGAKPTGTIVSFNKDAFSSYGKKKGENAPVSEEAEFAYTTALNYLLRSKQNRLKIGDTTVVFWATADTHEKAQVADDLFADILCPPNDDEQASGRIGEFLEGVRKGVPLIQLNPDLDPGTQMYVLGVSPNVSRISIRFWVFNRLDAITMRIADHANDMYVEPCPWKAAPSAYRLVLATVPNREGVKPSSDDAFQNLVGEMLRAVLTGGLYPRSLLANTVMRIRSDGSVSGDRVAICKGILTREQRLLQHHAQGVIPVSLDKETVQPGYLLGRLFAVLEYAQRAALGGNVNATIRDRFYGAASATPARIFPVLLRNTQNHMAKVRKERPGQAVNLEKLLQEIIDGLPEHFPRSLNLEDQGRFAIGYYHQSMAMFKKSDGAGNVGDVDDVQIEHEETSGEQQ